jgi:AraC-like DNA-binding protein
MNLKAVAIPDKELTERDTESRMGPFKPESWRDAMDRPALTVPTKSVRNVMAAASPRIETELICQTVGIEPSQLSDPQGRVPISKLVAAFETAAQLTGDGAFGLHVGARTQIRSFGLLGYIVMNCSTFGEALDRVARYFPIWTDGAAFRVINEGSSARLTWEYVDPSVVECRHDCEMTLLCVAKISHLLCDEGYRHREIHFQHPAPKDVSEHKRLFRTPVLFSKDFNQLIFDKTMLTVPLRSAEPELLELLIQFGDSLLAGISTRRTLLDHTRIALRQAILKGDVQLNTVSRSLGLGARTLQRKLKEHGVAYNELLSATRRDLAEHYLRGSQMTLREISDRLAFAQPGEFHRAFRQWTGTTPHRFRRVHSA